MRHAFYCKATSVYKYTLILAWYLIQSSLYIATNYSHIQLHNNLHRIMNSRWILLFVFLSIWIVDVHSQTLGFVVTDFGAVADGKTDSKTVNLDIYICIYLCMIYSFIQYACMHAGICRCMGESMPNSRRRGLSSGGEDFHGEWRRLRRPVQRRHHI